MIVAFWNKFGAPTEKFPSGTMEEFSLSYERKQKTGNPSIKVYFREPSPPKTEDDLEELRKIIKFKSTIEGVALYKEYSIIDEFRNLINEHINAWLTIYLKSPKTIQKEKIKAVLPSPATSRSMVKDVFKKVEEAYDTFEQPPKIGFGIPELDESLVKIEDVSLLTIASFGMSGKTSILITLINFTSVINSTPLFLFSTKTNKHEIMQRILSNESSVPVWQIREGKLSRDNWPSLTHAAGKLADASIFVDDTYMPDIDGLYAQISKMKEQSNIELVLIDDINHTKCSSGIIGRELRQLSRTLKVPIISTYQLANHDFLDHSVKELKSKTDIYNESDIFILLRLRKDPMLMSGWRELDVIVDKNYDSYSFTTTALFQPEISKVVGIYRDPGAEE
ncbi:MAG: hypothetical protein A2077_06210 [Nitrospirae bacterium GWC2_46_6]|nr:MAG: hypothetical protein A2077_06210 [Nitrospirae bacterium GWC2_46_6]